MKKTKGETISGGLRSMMLMVFLLFLVNGVGAQGFSNLYYDNRPAMMFGSIDARNDVFYVTGVTTNSLASGPPYYRKALFGKIANDGAVDSIYGIIDSSHYVYENFKNTLKRSIDGNYISVGAMTDSLHRVFLMKTDTSGNILLWEEYTEQQVLIFQGCDVVEIPNQGFLIIVNVQFNNYNGDIMVIRTDTNGNEINRVTLGLTNRELPWVVQSMFNRHYLIGTSSFKQNGTTPFWSKTWLVEIDSMGNMVNQWLDSDTKNRWPNNMQQTADSGWIIVRQRVAYDVSNVQGYIGSLLKLDKNFNKEWEMLRGDTGSYAGFYDVEILPDGKYVVSGATVTKGNDSAYQWGWLLKIDTDGTILWDRKYVPYPRFGAYGFLYDVDVLPNGDLLACGELQFTENVGITPIQQGWILRTDSNGCELSSCVTGISQSEIRHPKFAIFPNPASDQFNIEAEPTTQGELSIADELGRLLYTNPHFDGATVIKVNNWMNGIYFYRLRTSTNEQRSGKIVVQH